MNDPQVEQAPRLTAYPLWQVLQVAVEEQVAQFDRKELHVEQAPLLRAYPELQTQEEPLRVK